MAILDIRDLVRRVHGASGPMQGSRYDGRSGGQHREWNTVPSKRDTRASSKATAQQPPTKQTTPSSELIEK